jgi:hypothetical protein
MGNGEPIAVTKELGRDAELVGKLLQSDGRMNTDPVGSRIGCNQILEWIESRRLLSMTMFSKISVEYDIAATYCYPDKNVFALITSACKGPYISLCSPITLTGPRTFPSSNYPLLPLLLQKQQLCPLPPTAGGAKNAALPRQLSLDASRRKDQKRKG